jgi:hypothetical protein
MDEFQLFSRLTRRYFLYAAALPLVSSNSGQLLADTGEQAKEDVAIGKGTLELSCASFDCTPPLGFPAPTYGANPVVRKIDGPIDTRIFALRQGDLCIGWGNSDYNVFEETRERLAKTLGTPVSRTIFSCTHNHSTIDLKGLGEKDKTGFTQRFYGDLDKAVASLKDHFVPVSVSWGTGLETEITYNRKGRRPDGTTYFMREEDRVKLPASYVGQIDPTATVVRFDRGNGLPMLLVTHFTGHPVIAYNLEQPVVDPDFSGWALIDLLEAYAPAHPVGVFLQGCAGDINAKGMFSGPALARESGDKLGKVFIQASKHTHKIANPRLGFVSGVAHVPYAPLPPIPQLAKEKTELLAFQKRVDAGDRDTLHVLGYNFSETMTMGYRRSLADPFLKWTEWAIQMQKEGRPRPYDSLAVTVDVVSIGDLAIVAMPHELFSGIGLSIRAQSPFACTVPAAYSNGIFPNYIGTSKDVGDREYVSAFYRYAMRPPYAKPAGDAIADKAVELLNKLHSSL